jgi:hypothetical protein
MYSAYGNSSTDTRCILTIVSKQFKSGEAYPRLIRRRRNRKPVSRHYLKSVISAHLF